MHVLTLSFSFSHSGKVSTNGLSFTFLVFVSPVIVKTTSFCDTCMNLVSNLCNSDDLEAEVKAIRVTSL